MQSPLKKNSDFMDSVQIVMDSVTNINAIYQNTNAKMRLGLQ